MARDNRKDNRANAKAGNENKKPGEEYSELADDFDSNTVVEEEEIDDGGSDNGSDNNDKQDGDENVSKGEVDKKTDTIGIDKDAEVDGDDEGDGSKSEVDDKAKDVKDDTKTEEKTEDKTKADDKKPEPTAEEKKAAEEAEAKRLKDIADAEAKKKADETPKTLSNEEADALFKDWRSTTETLLAEHHYKLTEEDVAQLNENPAAYIPRAMSRVYLDTISASFQQFVNYLPRMVHQVLEAREQNSEQENAFFGRWPDLKAHKDAVIRLGAAYRQSNPAASQEDFINEVGAQAMVALRLNPQLQLVPDKAPEEEKKPSFKPANGGPGGGDIKPKSNNPFDQLLTEFAGQTEEEVDDS